MTYILRIVFVVILLTPSSAWAQGACYSTKEAEAEQGLRIHSELMVIGLNCMAMPLFAPKNLYGKYREFTAEHANLFAAYEDILMNYFNRTNAGNPKAEFNTLRTSLANKISTDAAQMRPDLFCLEFSPRIEKAAQMSVEEVRGWASTFYPSHPVSQPICE